MDISTNKITTGYEDGHIWWHEPTPPELISHEPGQILNEICKVSSTIATGNTKARIFAGQRDQKTFVLAFPSSKMITLGHSLPESCAVDSPGGILGEMYFSLMALAMVMPKAVGQLANTTSGGASTHRARRQGCVNRVSIGVSPERVKCQRCNCNFYANAGSCSKNSHLD